MFEVPYGQDPYSAIGRYIRENITVIEDIIAVISIDGVETNELFMVDMQEDGYFVWESDWWEGEENVTLIDFFPVSEAQRANQNVQSADTISRQAAIDAIETLGFVFSDSDLSAVELEELGEAINDVRQAWLQRIKQLPSAQPEQPSFSCGHEDDLISRQAAIDTANDWLLDCFKVQKQDRSCGLIRRLEDLPSAQPEPLTDKEQRIFLAAMGREEKVCEDAVKNLPSEQPEPCDVCRYHGLEDGDTLYISADWDGGIGFDYIRNIHYCPVCGRRLPNE